MKHKIEKLLEPAGITINGNKPYDIQIHNEKVYREIILKGSIGAGESYMRGWWDCEHVDELMCRLLKAQLDTKLENPLIIFLTSWWQKLINQQTHIKSKAVAHQHYNIGNSLYEYMLGKTMAYTCGYWREAHDLDSAQYAKYDLICRKISLKAGQRILELGCGFGGFAKYASEHYGCEVVAVNISKEQVKYAKVLCEGLSVQIFCNDYRDHPLYNPKAEKFDHVVSIGMCEHVGAKNYQTFMKVARQQLKDEGLFLIHTIGSDYSLSYANPWITKYIFPNSMLPSIQQLSRAAEHLFVVEDLHNFGADYDRTLMAWEHNFVQNWDKIKDRYSEEFYRMWRYYLLQSAGGFRARALQLWQFVLSPHGVANGYRSIR